jgi:altronate dehydratase small subunit
MEKYARIVNAKDNVVTLVSDCNKGDEIIVNIDESEVTYTADANIKYGHKMAIKDIKKGEPIIKYGEHIGDAIEDISAGTWVHIHNVQDTYKCLDKDGNPLPGQENECGI